VAIIITKGIVLKSFKYSESSLIVSILTEHNGKMSFIANGVRKKNSRMSAAYFQSLNIINIGFFDSKKSDLKRIVEVSNAEILNDLIFNINKSSVAMFIAEFIYNSMDSNENDTKLYTFLEHLIQYLDSASDNEICNIHIWSLIRLMQFYGISPENNFNENNRYFNPLSGLFTNDKYENSKVYSERESILLHLFYSSKIDESCEIKTERIEKQMLLNLLTEYYQLHIEGFKVSKSLSILKEVFD
jgi:DNA repair protein RecO (recombination protein O)